MFEGCGGLGAQMDLREDFARPPVTWRHPPALYTHVAENKAFAMRSVVSGTPNCNAYHLATLW